MGWQVPHSDQGPCPRPEKRRLPGWKEAGAGGRTRHSKEGRLPSGRQRSSPLPGRLVTMPDRHVLVNLRGLLTPDPARAWAVDRISDAALAVAGGRVVWLGRAADLPADWADAPRMDGDGALGHPGLRGPPYPPALRRATAARSSTAASTASATPQIAAEGGGIRETVRATRGRRRGGTGGLGENRACKPYREQGVVHLEAKTGYGLELEAESRLLEAYARAEATGLEPGRDPDARPRPGPRNSAATPTATSAPWPRIGSRNWCAAIRAWRGFCDVFVEKGVFTRGPGPRSAGSSGRRPGPDPADPRRRVLPHRRRRTGRGAGRRQRRPPDVRLGAGHGGHGPGRDVPTLLPATTLFLGMRDFAPARQDDRGRLPGGPGLGLQPRLLRLHRSPPGAAPGLPAAAPDLRGGLHGHDPARRPQPGSGDLGHLHPGARADVNCCGRGRAVGARWTGFGSHTVLGNLPSKKEIWTRKPSMAT